MANASVSLTVCINADENRIYLYENNAQDVGNCVSVDYAVSAINEELFEAVARILTFYKQGHTYISLSNVSLILPDSVFLTDMLTIPNLGKKMVGNSLNLVIGTLYKNKNELTYNTFPLSQNKQTSVYGMVGVRKALLDSIHKKFEGKGIHVQNVTFAANAMANGAMAINQKLRTATALLLDIRENFARFAFLNKGRTLGAYSLPFGYTILYKSYLAAEDQLFDYSSAELLVLNAKEKAQAKRLTVMDEGAFSNDGTTAPTQDASSYTEGNETEEDVVGNYGGRKLPKFMLREIPTDEQGFVYENFRIFQKWALELIASNTAITEVGNIDTVYVNMPKEYDFLFDMVNREEKENGVVFAPMFENATEKPLEMYGGFYVKQYNKLNNF